MCTGAESQNITHDIHYFKVYCYSNQYLENMVPHEAKFKKNTILSTKWGVFCPYLTRMIISRHFFYKKRVVKPRALK